jgi:hypothetical protein
MRYLKLTNSSKSQIETSVVNPGSRNRRRKVHRLVVPRRTVVVIVFGGFGGWPQLFSDLLVHRQSGFGPQQVDVDEEQEEQAAEEQVDVEKLKIFKNNICKLWLKNSKFKDKKAQNLISVRK